METKQKNYTEAWLVAQHPCADGFEFAKSCDFDFSKIYDTCQRGDWLLWLLRHAKLGDKHQFVQVACDCAAYVLNEFEQKYPKDRRPRQAIETARAWLNGRATKEECKQACAAAAYATNAHNVVWLWQANKVRELIPNPFIHTKTK